MPSRKKSTTGSLPADAPHIDASESIKKLVEHPVQGPVFEDHALLSPRDIRDAIVIKEGDLFLLTDLVGNVPPGNRDGFGLYHKDTRFLSGYELVIEGLRPTILLSTGRSHFLEAQVLTNPNFETPEGQTVHENTIQIRRYHMLRPWELDASLTFENFNVFPLKLDIAFLFEADFADIFEVRGLVKAERHDRRHAVDYRDREMRFSYEGQDNVGRSTVVRFDPAPETISTGNARYQLELPARGSQRISITVQLRSTSNLGGNQSGNGRGADTRSAKVGLAGYKDWLGQHVALETSNTLFNETIRQYRHDLRVLMSGEDDIPFAAAGIPWYATLFGRDSLITAIQDLWMSSWLAKQTLRLLARSQGTRDDPWRDEEPGKIMHEVRRGELANRGLVPFSPYYGTVDATPLWVMLLGEYYRSSGDLELVQELRPNMDAALEWCDRYGDADGDGFIEYRSRSASGLVNQGWKDSWDGVVHADGSLLSPPIALVEVQAYVYAAKQCAARLYHVLGDLKEADQRECEAERLKDKFNEVFWLPSMGYYCMALDQDKRPAAVVGSNPGHALWCGIVPPDRAAQVATRLMSEDMYSGWGIRSLSTQEARYNPAGYHLGTVWPHDNALIALGLKRYGQEAHVVELMTGMYEAAQHFPSFRMPELFCGLARSAFGVPVRYPVACSPQAWAAVSWSAFLQASLGIQLDAPARELRIVRPKLPHWLKWIRVSRIVVGNAQVDLYYQRIDEHTAVDVTAMRGDVRVTFVDKWESA